MAHGLIPVRLTEIPFDKRMSAARLAARQWCVDDTEIREVMLAALFPSDSVHWVRAQAAAQVDDLRAAA